METYLLKTILCALVFIGFYFLALENKKTHQFKRFYLLLSLLFSLLIPLISIRYGVEKPMPNDFFLIEQSNEYFAAKTEKPSVFTLENILYLLYFLVTTVFITRFLLNILALRKEIRTGKKIQKGNYFYILKDEKQSPHSFWNCIFLHRNDFEKGKIDEKIIRHEEAHLVQKHSLDVLVIEFLLAVLWFNPAFYFYKKAIITNHEFLADEAVLAYENNATEYQKLLLTELISEKILFTNPFNLSNTKKRIKMMTTPNNYKSKLFSWLTLPLSALLFFAFVEKIPAKSEITKKRATKSATAILLNKETAKKEDLKIFELFEKENSITKKDTIKPKIQKTKEEDVHKSSSENELQPLPSTATSVEIVASETPAEFPGGMSALRNAIMQNTDTSKIKPRKEPYKGVVHLSVLEDGNSADVFLEFEDKDFMNIIGEAAQKSIKNVKWKPGTKDGKPTISHLKMPIMMKFE